MNNNLSTNLKKIRKDNNLSQEELAEILGVSRQSVSKWESGLAYPEMEKIIQICKRFDININDLLQNDISEVKGEESSKNKVNSIIESCLKFITNSINMFINMSFGSKLKCIIEQLIIFAVLSIMTNYLGRFLEKAVYGLLYFTSGRMMEGIRNCISYLYYILSSLVIIGIMVYVFKNRYLDYYQDILNNKSNENKETLENEKKNKETSVNSFEIQKEKIIIRNPDNSEYRFINFIIKCLIVWIKFNVFFLLIFSLLSIVASFACFILSFLVYKTGIFFFGLLLACLSFGVLSTVISIFFINFIFNRKNNKKCLILTFVGSIIGLGISIGMIFSGTLNFNIYNKRDHLDYFEKKTIKIKMIDGMSLNSYYDHNINYIEKDIKDIEVEAYINKTAVLEYKLYNKELYITEEFPNILLTIRKELKTLNDTKSIYLSNGFDLNIYASKKNIELLKKNSKNN